MSYYKKYIQGGIKHYIHENLLTFNHSNIYLSAHILGGGGSRVSVLRHRWSARGGPKSSWRFANNVDVKHGAESIAWKQHAERGNRG